MNYNTGVLYRKTAGTLKYLRQHKQIQPTKQSIHKQKVLQVATMSMLLKRKPSSNAQQKCSNLAKSPVRQFAIALKDYAMKIGYRHTRSAKHHMPSQGNSSDFAILIKYQ